MPKTREQKEQEVAELTEALKGASASVLTNYQGLGVRDQQELQNSLREQGMRFHVAKLTLLNRAAKEAGIELDTLEGQQALAIGADDPVGVAKAVAEFAKEHEALEITGGIVDGKQVGVELIQRYASLPGRDELLGRLMGSISAPVRNLASGLSGVSRNLVYALTAVKEKKA
ncbi:50S ribosomal protein L10 [Patescibacteria group bacterium]|nr:50S ribosomal protein L10 [Patescibacteria group bacterium]